MAHFNHMHLIAIPGGRLVVLTPDLNVLLTHQNFYLVKFTRKKRSKRAINSPNWLPIR